MSECIDLLKRRGFFIEENNGSYYLSEDSHSDDLRYIKEILIQNKVGYIQEPNQIIITNEDNLNHLFHLFAPCKKGTVGVSSLNQDRKWFHVKKRDHADKIPVEWLEANIARYIKALSACGIYTGGCCDGNHPNFHILYIEFDGPVYSELHAYFWKYHLNNLFTLNWDNNYTSIDVSTKKEFQYDELNKAAAYIDKHRVFFREVRKSSMSWLTNKIEKKGDPNLFKSTFLEQIKLHLTDKEILNAYKLQ